MGPLLAGSMVKHSMGRMWPLLQSHTIYFLLESPTLIPPRGVHTGSGWVQLAVPTSEGSSVGQAHQDLCKHIKKPYVGGYTGYERGQAEFIPLSLSWRAGPGLEPLREMHSECPSSEPTHLSSAELSPAGLIETDLSILLLGVVLIHGKRAIFKFFPNSAASSSETL